MEGILLIAMPWQKLELPSLQLGCLVGYLKKKGLSADARYVNFEIALKLGIENYNAISQKFSESYREVVPLGDLLYSYLLFPQNRDKIKKFLKKNSCEEFLRLLPDIEEHTDAIAGTIPRQKYSYVGLTTTYLQLSANIYFAKKLKFLFPDKKIIFGGVGCMGRIGSSLMECFPEIDFVVNGEGEETLFKLLQGRTPLDQIPNLVWRRGQKVILNKNKNQINNLDVLPAPDYSDYFMAAREQKMDLSGQVVLPYETSRGCWHNPKCYFCNYTYYWRGYRAKSQKRILEDLSFLSRRYKIRHFYLADSVVNSRIGEIFKELPKIGGGIILTKIYFKIPKNKETLESLVKTGVKHITVGVDAICASLLKKMGKGVAFIDNVRTLKWCRELGMKVTWNIITGIPTEEKKDVDESIGNIDYLRDYAPPHTPLSTYAHLYGSMMHKEPWRFNIRKTLFPPVYKVLFPGNIADKVVPYFFGLKLDKPRSYSYRKLLQKVEEWKGRYQKNRPALYYIERGRKLFLMDKRAEKAKAYLFTGFKKDLYLFCDDIKTFAQIIKHFNVSAVLARRLLADLWQKKLLFKEGDRYLSLAINYHRWEKSNVKDRPSHEGVL